MISIGFLLGSTSLSGKGGIVPTLSLDFINMGTLDPRIVFTRSSNATIVDSTGKVDFAPNNIAANSNNFTHAGWGKARATIVPDAIDGPFPGTRGSKFIATNVSGDHAITPTGSVGSIAKRVYIMSIYAKAAEYSKLYTIGMNSTFPSNNGTMFDLANGTVTKGINATQAYITSAGSGWYRCTLVVSSLDSAVSGATLYWYVANTTGSLSYVGDNMSGIYIYGAQVELSLYRDSPMPYMETGSTGYFGPRFDYDPITKACKGLLVEDATTNYLTNSSMVGATIGGVSVGNVWGVQSYTAGINASIVNAGQGFIDIRVNGTATSAGNYDIRLTGNVPVSAAVGDIWTASAFIQLLAGTWPVRNTNLGIWDLNSSGVWQGSSSTSLNTVALGAPLTRIIHTRTLAAATTARVDFRVGIDNLKVSDVIDFTFRLAYPQLEKRATPTSWVPTSLASATRTAELASIVGTNLSNIYNQSEGTFLVEFDRDSLSVNARALTLVGSAGYEIILRGAGTPSTSLVSDIKNAYSSDVMFSTVTSNPNTVTKAVLAYKSNNTALSVNGEAPVLDNTVVVPSVNSLYIGSGTVDQYNTANQITGHIRRIQYFPQRLPNSTIKLLST